MVTARKVVQPQINPAVQSRSCRASRFSRGRENVVACRSGHGCNDVGDRPLPIAATRRALVLSLAAPSLLVPLALGPEPAFAVRDGTPVDVDPVSPFALEDFVPEEGWTELASGLLFKVVKEGEGDKEKGIFDKVDHFQPFPFVTVRYTAYEPSGKAIASTISLRRDYNYQAGVRQEIQDEDGAVMSMKVGERRQFVAPLELAFKRKLFGQPVPQKEAILVDVELLYLQPY